MRFRFSDMRRPARMSKLVRSAYAGLGQPIGLIRAQDVCARLYGYPTYHELKAAAGRGAPCRWDDHVAPEIVAARRAHQVVSLCADGLPREAALAFVEANRPTGSSRRGGGLPDGVRGPSAHDASRPGDGEDHAFARHLVTNRLVSPAHVRAALWEQRATGELIGEILVRAGHIGRDRMLEAVASHLAADEGAEPARILDRLLHRAIRYGATLIEVEPRADGHAVHFTRACDRCLIHLGPLSEYEAIAASLRSRVDMASAERRPGQGAGFGVEHAGRIVGMGLTVEGDRLVVRVMDPMGEHPWLDQLGIGQVETWKRGISRSNGLCLIVGEAGSGKTVALGASVRELDRFGKRIYTAVDPVEYRIPYVGQISLEHGTGYRFAQAIRNFMHAEPEVLALGHVETADEVRNAIDAAERGFMVLVTLHAEDILSGLARLQELGVKGYELRFILRAILAQRSVRTSGGGRTVVSECHGFMSHGDVDEVLRIVAEGGKGTGTPWRSMIDDGIDKMLAGIVSAAELERSFGREFIERCRERGVDPSAHG